MLLDLMVPVALVQHLYSRSGLPPSNRKGSHGLGMVLRSGVIFCWWQRPNEKGLFRGGENRSSSDGE